ncbi:hypothetical protein [Phenylobacterium soli]|uniref:hypothetical protein n=1 Tax=Phenylobacterium soli TaxID=2170551 RepID=UPI001D055746|nr:hypothetical protein [Phenylobacterium soli]
MVVLVSTRHTGGRRMQRFILQSNIERYRTLLGTEDQESSRAWLLAMIAAGQRELAVLNAAVGGVRVGPAPPGSRLARANRLRAEFQKSLETCDEAVLILEPGPGLHIVDLSEVYAQATLIERSAVAGELIFDVFPDNPADPTADGVSNLYASLRRAAETGQADAMAVQRYDVRGPDGVFVEKFWSPINTPVFDEGGHLAYIVHRVQDVTGRMRPHSLSAERPAASLAG